jgi:hypothetical protein
MGRTQDTFWLQSVLQPTMTNKIIHLKMSYVNYLNNTCEYFYKLPYSRL